MPRILDKKLIQTRIKLNKRVMRASKVSLNAEMNSVLQGEGIDQKNARQQLTLYMRAALAVTADNAKLNLIEQQ